MAHGKLGYGADPIHVYHSRSAMMMMQRFDVVALLLQQEQRMHLGGLGKSKNV
jgi:hypothetical protein